MAASDAGAPASDRAASALARLNAAKAEANDAHVDARDDLALVESLLVSMLESVDGDERVASARLLLRLAASGIAGNRPLPAPLRKWLSEALLDAARPRKPGKAGPADRALGLVRGSGKFFDLQRHMRNVGQMHALMQWHGFKAERAASAALPTTYVVAGAATGAEDVSALVKARRALKKNWAIKGPYLAEDDGYPCEGNVAATIGDLRAGRNVSVVFERLPADEGGVGAVISVGVLLPRRLSEAS